MKSVTHYLAAARQFDRLARLETHPQIKRLLQEQATTCVRLTLKQGKETNPGRPPRPPPLDLIG
jgi:hypothetical protein